MRSHQTQKLFLVVVALSPAMANAQTKPAPKPAAKPPAAVAAPAKPKPPPATPTASAPVSAPASASSQSRWRIDANGLTFVADLGNIEKGVAGGTGTAGFGAATEKVDNIDHDAKSGAISFRLVTAGYAKWFKGKREAGAMAGEFSYHAGAPAAPKPTNAADYKFKWSAREVDASGRAIWRQTPGAGSGMTSATTPAQKPKPIRTGPPCTPGISRNALWHVRAGFEFFDLDMTSADKDAAGGKGTARVSGKNGRVDPVDSIAYDEKTAKISFRRRGKDSSQWFDGCISRNVIHGRFSQQKADAPKPTDDAAFAMTFYGRKALNQPLPAVNKTAVAARISSLIAKLPKPNAACTPRASRYSVWRVNANGFPMVLDLSKATSDKSAGGGTIRVMGKVNKVDSVGHDDKTGKIAFRRLGPGFSEWFTGCVGTDRIVGRYAHVKTANANRPDKEREFIYPFSGQRVSAPPQLVRKPGPKPKAKPKPAKPAPVVKPAVTQGRKR